MFVDEIEDVDEELLFCGWFGIDERDLNWFLFFLFSLLKLGRLMGGCNVVVGIGIVVVFMVWFGV